MSVQSRQAYRQVHRAACQSPAGRHIMAGRRFPSDTSMEKEKEMRCRKSLLCAVKVLYHQLGVSEEEPNADEDERQVDAAAKSRCVLDGQSQGGEGLVPSIAHHYMLF